MTLIPHFLLDALVSVLLALAPGAAPHLVGDSTAHQATVMIGHGSGHPGHGFVSSVHALLEAEEPFLNPLDPAPDPSAPAVGFVSVWDAGQADLAGYVEATRAYPGGVIWVEVPPFRDHDRAVDPRLDALNDGVAATLGCELVPWTWRDVDTSDGIHPTPAGVATLVDRMTALTRLAEPCEIAGATPSSSTIH